MNGESMVSQKALDAPGDARTIASNDMQQISETIAEAFSTSLAGIATESRGRSLAWEKERHHVRATRDAPSSSEEGVDSSSGRSGKSSDPALVTANTTASSSEDRGSSGGNRNGGFSNTNSSGDDRFVHASLAAQRDHSSSMHYHHHGRQQKRSGESSETSSDGYGLPVPRDDSFRASKTSSEHASVVARLPPPTFDGANSSCSGGEGDNNNAEQSFRETGSLLQPRREPGFHTIRTTLNQFMQMQSNKSSETDSSGEHVKHRKSKHSSKRLKSDNADRKTRKRTYRERSNSNKDGAGSTDENGGSSGSGTEGGYAGSASSNEPIQAGSCSSPSVSSSDSSHDKRKLVNFKPAMSGDPNRPMLSKKQESSLSVSSEIADFSSSASESAAESYSLHAFRDSSPSPSDSPSITSSSNNGGSSDDQEDYPLEANKTSDGRTKGTKRVYWPPLPLQVSSHTSKSTSQRRKHGQICDAEGTSTPALCGKPPIMSVGCDVMAHILTFLEPPDILDVLTSPLSKDWLSTFTRQPELWRVLCLLEPFKACVKEGDSSDDSSDDSLLSCPFDVETQLRQTFGKFRLLYTSFVKCMRYLAQIREDAINGRAPSMVDRRNPNAKLSNHDISANQNLRHFLARARGVVNASRPSATSSDLSDDDANNVAQKVAQAVPVGLADDGSSQASCRKRKASSGSGNKKKKLKFASSKLTQRLLGPSQTGEPGDVNLPWSCAIYSIVNWMAAFAGVEGIQTMCLKVLPLILENEQHRITAQRAGLTDIVLRGMVLFPESSQLHTAAFHTVVLLARPLGGQEGMLFHTSMVNASGIFGTDSGAQCGRNGIAVMLDSMRRFQRDGVLQAMSCWSLVNIALAPAQKQVLVKLGGIQATANAMMNHPHNAEVQFRGLFALINLVIPSVSLNPGEDGETQPVAGEDSTEREMLDEMVDQIVNLVVLAMKNFCSSEAILNRACLVLHNLSLTGAYHSALLWTPNCYQMLDWCLVNYRTDQVLQQSAAGTLHRLQLTLSSDDTLRARFSASLQAQQQQSLEEAHREAIYLRNQQEEVLRRQQDAS